VAARLESNEPTTILETNDPGLLGVAKSLLEAAGIAFFAKGDALVLGSGGGSVKLQVAGDQATEAEALLAELKRPKGARVLRFPPKASS
jgi:hypothetical protein